MPADVYVQINDRTLGPITTEALKKLIREGRVTSGTLIRRGVEGQWVRAAEIRGFHEMESTKAGRRHQKNEATPTNEVPGEAPGDNSHRTRRKHEFQRRLRQCPSCFETYTIPASGDDPGLCADCRTEGRLWQCPNCFKTYMIPASANGPGLCPNCPTESKPQLVEEPKAKDSIKDKTLKWVNTDISPNKSESILHKDLPPELLWTLGGLVFVVLVSLSFILHEPEPKPYVSPQMKERMELEEQHVSAPKWYEGGTLHRKSALEWQTASSHDKLATCADFVTTMWKNGDLKPSIANRISTVNDVRPYAQELVNFLDAAFERDPDPEQNRKLFTNQTVSSTAAIGMVTMGWTK